MLKSDKQSIRYALVGECNVGKTTLARRFMEQPITVEPRATIGVDKHEKTFDSGGEKHNMILLDMAGSYQFQSVVESYLNRADAVVFVYDVTDKESFATLPLWNTLVEKGTKGRRKVAKMLVGNKKDLARHFREVPSNMAKNYANFEGMVHIEISAKTDANMDIILHCLTQEVTAMRAAENVKLKGLQKLASAERTRFRLAPWVKSFKFSFNKARWVT